MRRVLLLCLVLFIALASVETINVVAGDWFILDQENYSVNRTLDDAVVVSLNSFSEILKVDDCVYEEVLFACLVSADNESASIDISARQADISVGVDTVSSVQVGDVFDVVVSLRNSGSLASDVEVLLVVEGAEVSDSDDFSDDLSYVATLEGDRRSEASVELVSSRAGDIVVYVDVFSEQGNFSEQVRISAVDDLDVSVSYPDVVSLYEEYTFSLSITDSLLREAEVLVTVPTSVSVVSDKNLSLVGNTLSNSMVLNDSFDASFDYEVLGGVEEQFYVQVATTDSSRVERLYTYSYSVLQSQALNLSYSVEKPALVNQETDVVYHIRNPANTSVTADLSISGRLLTEDVSVSLAAFEQKNISFSVVSNRSGEYGLFSEISFENDIGDELTSSVFAEIVFVDDVPQQEFSSVRIVGPARLAINDSGLLELDMQGVSGRVNVSWYREDVLVDSSSSEVGISPISLAIDAPGSFSVVVDDGSEVYEASFVVAEDVVFEQPVERNDSVASPSEDVQEEDSSISVVFWAVSFLTVFLVLLYGLHRYRLSQMYAEVLSLQPKTPQQVQEQLELLLSLSNKTNKKL